MDSVQTESWTLKVIFALIMAPVFLVLAVVMSRHIEAGAPVQWLFIFAVVLVGITDGVNASMMRIPRWRNWMARLSPGNRKRVGEALLLSLLGAAVSVGPGWGPSMSIFVFIAYIPVMFLLFFAVTCAFDWVAGHVTRWWTARRG